MDAESIAARTRLIRETITSASVELTSDDHAVTVVVGPGGAVRDLHLSPRAFRYGGAELGEVVVRTIRAASDSMGRELSASMAEILGHAVDPSMPGIIGGLPDVPATGGAGYQPDGPAAGAANQPGGPAAGAAIRDAGRRAW